MGSEAHESAVGQLILWPSALVALAPTLKLTALDNIHLSQSINALHHSPASTSPPKSTVSGQGDGSSSEDAALSCIAQSLCDHTNWRIKNYSTDARSFKHMMVSERRAVVRGILQVSASRERHQLLNISTHVNNLKQRRHRRCDNSLSTSVDE